MIEALSLDQVMKMHENKKNEKKNVEEEKEKKQEKKDEDQEDKEDYGKMINENNDYIKKNKMYEKLRVKSFSVIYCFIIVYYERLL